MTEPILSFTGNYTFLSNFYPSQVRLDGVVYPTLEHAFQAAKVPRGDARVPFRNAPTAGKAKCLGRSCQLRADWEAVKFDIMRDLVRDKFTNATLRAKLLATGDATLVEENTWGDRTWGQVDGVGENWLGRLVMQVRGELQPTSMQVAAEALHLAANSITRANDRPTDLTLLSDARKQVTEACFMASKALSSAYNDAIKEANGHE